MSQELHHTSAFNALNNIGEWCKEVTTKRVVLVIVDLRYQTFDFLSVVSILSRTEI